MSTLKKLEQIIQNGTPILQELKDASKSAHIASRDTAWEFYTDWRDSSEGQKWKQQKQLDCKNTCPECGKVGNLTIDHKIPRKKAPWLAWDINNLWLLCKNCNLEKDDMDWSEYLKRVKIYRGQSAVKRILKAVGDI